MELATGYETAHTARKDEVEVYPFYKRCFGRLVPSKRLCFLVLLSGEHTPLVSGCIKEFDGLSNHYLGIHNQ